MFTVIITSNNISHITLGNIRILSQSVRVEQIILLNCGDKIQLERPISKTTVVKSSKSVFPALNDVIKNDVTQPHIILLDSNIQIGSVFIDKVIRHYADNHLYTFKVNSIGSNNSVTVDPRLGNKISFNEFNIGALAFSTSNAKSVDAFGEGELIQFAKDMSESGVKLKMMNQVLVHQNTAGAIITDIDMKHRRPITRRVSTNKPNKSTTPISPHNKDVMIEWKKCHTDKKENVTSKTIKYSFIIPYINRGALFTKTLESLKYWYSYRNDFEIIIVEDIKNTKNYTLHKELLSITKKFKSDNFAIRVVKNSTVTINPATHYNKGVSMAKGRYVIITNPECFHMNDILEGFDTILAEQKNPYIVCGCINGIITGDSYDKMSIVYKEWYQHSVHRSASFHFCSCMSKDNYFDIGGFDEDYSKGYAIEDVDFVERLMSIDKIKFFPADNLLVLHQSHDVVRPDNWFRLHMQNKRTFFEKWGRIPSAIPPKPVEQKK